VPKIAHFTDDVKYQHAKTGTSPPIFKRKMINDMKKKFWIILGSIYLLIIIAILPFCHQFSQGFSSILEDIFPNPKFREFSPEVWDEYPYERGHMVNDLLENYDLVGMTKDEVIELLGEKRLTINEYGLIYETSGGFLKDERLFLSVDENGIITDVGLPN